MCGRSTREQVLSRAYYKAIGMLPALLGLAGREDSIILSCCAKLYSYKVIQLGLLGSCWEFALVCIDEIVLVRSKFTTNSVQESSFVWTEPYNNCNFVSGTESNETEFHCSFLAWHLVSAIWNPISLDLHPPFCTSCS